MSQSHRLTPPPQAIQSGDAPIGAETPHRFTKAAWRSIDAVESPTPEWVDWHNNGRLLKHIVNIAPTEAEAAYFASQEETAIAA